MRAKFRIHEAVKRGEDNAGNYTYMIVQMHPVYSSDKTTENYAFWDATPSGALSMQINNPRAFEFFEQGAEYYIDFTKV